MKGWVLVDSRTVAPDDDLHSRVDIGMDFAAGLPPK
jgi:hypothetical protein